MPHCIVCNVEHEHTAEIQVMHAHMLQIIVENTDKQIEHALHVYSTIFANVRSLPQAISVAVPLHSSSAQ